DPHGNVAEYLSIADSAQTGLSFNSQDAALTIAGWVRAELTDSTDGLLAMFDPVQDIGYAMSVTRGGSLQGGVGRAGLTTGAQTPGLLQKGVWQHVALVYDPASDQLRLYVDGTLQGLALHTGGIQTLPGSLFVLGSSGAVAGADFFSGN